MTDFIDEDLSGSRFERINLAGSRFERINLSGAEFSASDMVDTRFRGVQMRGVELSDVDIYGEIGNLTINGVDVGPGERRARPEVPRAGQDAPDQRRRLPRGVGCR